MAAGFSIGALSLHAAQYAPRARVSRKPRTPRRSVITVSAIVGPPHWLHAIAMSRLRSPFSTGDINRRIERIKNNNDALRSLRPSKIWGVCRSPVRDTAVSMIYSTSVPIRRRSSAC
jgi:hypothetical protein